MKGRASVSRAREGRTIPWLLAAVALLLLGSQARAQLAVDVRVTPDPVQPGELLRSELTVTFTGSGTATNVRLQNVTSASAALVSIDGGSCSFSNCALGSTVTWNLGSLSSGQSVKRELISRVGTAVAGGTMLTSTTKVTATSMAEADVSNSVTVDPTRTLSLAIVPATGPAVSGEPLTYILNYANRASTADAGVVLQAVVPSGTQFVSATQGGTEQSGVVTWDLGALGVGESGERRFTVTVTATTGAVFSSAQLSDGAPSVVRVHANSAVPVETEPPLTLDMTLTPDPIHPGELLRLQLTVQNRSQTTVMNAVVQDQTLDGTTIVSIDGGVCNFSNCAPGSMVTWSPGTVLPGQSLQRQVILRAGATVSAGTLLLNAARVTATNAPEAHADRAVAVDPARTLVAAITQTSEPAVPGESLTYVVNFANAGDTAAAGVLLQAPVPIGTQFVSATQGGSEDNGIVSWSLDTIGVGESGERRFTVQVTDMSAEAVFGAVELSDGQVPSAFLVRAESATPALATPPLTLDMTLTPDPVQPGELLRVELIVRNRSAITVMNPSLEDQTLDDTSIVSIDGGVCNFSNCAPGSAVTWALGALAPGQSAKRQLILRAGATVPAATLLFDTARATASNAPVTHAGRTAPVESSRPLSVAVTSTGEPAVPGETLTYVVNFANGGDSAHANVVLQAPVPAGTQFVSATQGGTEDNGVVSWNLDTVGVGASGERRFTVQVTDMMAEAVFGAAELSEDPAPGALQVRAESATRAQTAPPLTLDMTLTPDPVQPGELLRFDLTVQNRSLITVSNASLQHQTLDGTTIISIDGGVCNFSNCAPGSSVTWAIGTLSPGQAVMHQLVLRAAGTAAAGTFLSNTAHVTATNAAEVHASRSVAVTAARALAVAIAEETEPAVPGAPVTYVVSFANNGNSAETGLVLQAEVPAGTQFVSAVPEASEQDGIVSWPLGTVGVGQSGEHRFTVTVTDATVQALFSAAELSDALTPVRAEAAVPVRTQPPLALDVTLTPNPMAPNDQVHYEFTVQNNSLITVTGASLEDLTLDGTTIVAVDGGVCNFSNCAAGSTVTWGLGNLAPGASATRTLDLRIQSAVSGGILLPNSARASGIGALSVRVDRNMRVCTVPVCEPAPPGATPTITPTAMPTSTGVVPTATPTPAATDTPPPSAVATVTPTSIAATLTPTVAPPVCTGDCNGSGTVTVDELITLVNIAVGIPGGFSCPVVSGTVTINQIIAAVFHALNGCAATAGSA